MQSPPPSGSRSRRSRDARYAQDPAASPPTEGTAPAGGDATTPPATTPGGPSSASLAPTDVTLRQGAISIDGDIVIDLSKEQAGKPIQIVPNLYYGVNDALTVGIAHNTNAEIFQANVGPGGRGLCLSGQTDGCRKLYNNLSLDALFSFMRSSTMDMAAHGGIDFFFLNDPNWTQLRLGVKGKLMAGPVIIVFDPALLIGLNNRDQGNKEAINIPARFGFMVTPQLNLGLSIALSGLPRRLRRQLRGAARHRRRVRDQQPARPPRPVRLHQPARQRRRR